MIIGSLSGWLMLQGMIARPRATSARTNSGVMTRITARRSRLMTRRPAAAADLRRLFSRIAMELYLRVSTRAAHSASGTLALVISPATRRLRAREGTAATGRSRDAARIWNRGPARTTSPRGGDPSALRRVPP